MNDVLYEITSLKKSFKDGGGYINVINNMSFVIKKGQSIALWGRSGSGKSTLLQLIAGIDAPSSGEITYLGHNINKFNEKQKNEFRRRNLGFIYQHNHLMPELSAFENIILPLLIDKIELNEATSKTNKILHELEMLDKKDYLPYQLSGGQKQRVAIARAVIANPNCILADEPTGSLDSATANRVIKLIKSLQIQNNSALVMVTHDRKIAEEMDVIVDMNN